MIPEIGNVDIQIIYDILTEPGIIILLFLAGLAGLLRGKMEHDQARLGVPEYKGMENVSLMDWGEDFLLGIVGGFIGLGVLLMTPFPVFLLVPFGYAGRKLLIAWGRKAEATLPNQ